MTHLRAGSHGVPSPTHHVGKSQHEGKVPTSKPQETNKIWLTIVSWLIHAKLFVGFVLRLGSTFFARPNFQHKSQVSPPKFFAMYTSISYLGLGPWTIGLCVKWYFPTSMISTAEIARIDLKWLRTWYPWEPALISPKWCLMLILSTWQTYVFPSG
jgi:hypothetical protein